MGEQTERLKVEGTMTGGSPLWKIVTTTGRTVAYCPRQSDAQRIVQAWNAAPVAQPGAAGEGDS